jgi:hypothetical protein
MKKGQRVGAMADEVLARQARARAERTGESFEEALEAVRNTEAGRQLEELSEGPHRHEKVRSDNWGARSLLSWRGVVTSRCDLLPPNFPRILGILPGFARRRGVMHGPC